MNFNLTIYLKVLLHTIVALVIVLSLPSVMFILLDVILNVSPWVVIVGSLAPATLTIYWMLKYIWFVD